MKQTEKKKRYRKDIRHYFSESVIVTIVISCLIAAGMVLTAARIIQSEARIERLTPRMLCVLSICLCCITISLTGVILYFRTRKITELVTRLNEAIMKIAGGDFKVRMKENKHQSKSYQYENELDELTENLNKMVTELDGMDYMRKDFMRKDFMSNVSHEVKTPVAAITGFSEILLDGNLSDEEQKEYLTLVNQESIRLSALCENMLRMSRLDHQEIVSAKDMIRVDEQLRKCMIMLSEKWQEKNIEFLPELAEIKIMSDRNLLMQVWMNLIDNAMKYSHNNSQIHIRLEQDRDAVFVQIQDYGIGIAADKLDKIFNRFYQCEESHKKQGSWLGLSIVKRILDLLHGTIDYKSEQGTGTTVTVRMKLS